MTEQLQIIAERIKSLREILKISEETIAAECGLSLEEYLKYERAETDFSFSVLHNIANALGIDISDLLTGESARLTKYIITRAGGGHTIRRNDAYEYKHLALNFQNKLIEPFIVTLDPCVDPDSLRLNSHKGQELDYVIEGTLKIILDDKEIELSVGDSLFYDSSIPHAMYAINDKAAKFLAIVTK